MAPSNDPNTFRRRLFSALLYGLAVLLLVEDWLWEMSDWALAKLDAYRIVRRIDDAIARLPPYAALASFVLPALALIPIKILAVFALAKGHAFCGIAILFSAKILGAALSARLYTLTRPALMQIAWLARWLTAFVAFKNRLIARIRETRAWQQVRAAIRRVRHRMRILASAIRKELGPSRLRRAFKKLRSRRRGKDIRD